MRRETTNKIRFVFEELFPPIVRDSFLFRWLVRSQYGDFADRFMRFREQVPFMTAEEFGAFYRDYHPILEDSYLTRGCHERIERDVTPGEVADIGCGNAQTLRVMSEQPRFADRRFTGVDIAISDEVRKAAPRVAFEEASLDALPYEDGRFDTVICTHTLEHILDIRAAVAQLRRVAKRRLIIVVPRERPYKYTFNPHVHFFAYIENFLAHMTPIPERHHVEIVDRDIYYREDRD